MALAARATGEGVVALVIVVGVGCHLDVAYVSLIFYVVYLRAEFRSNVL